MIVFVIKKILKQMEPTNIEQDVDNQLDSRGTLII